MDDIINIDECLSDSFSLSSDTDIRNIVDQWKQNDVFSENKDTKIFDTRTFTRPKKRLFSNSDNSFTSRSNASLSESNQSASINLQIGGLVTSMQRSFLGDVSPPVSVLIETSSMGNSLITSSDFTNLNDYDYFGDEDNLNSVRFNRYPLKDTAKDRNFLEKLTTYDDSLFTKDANIENTDENQILSNSMGNSTLLNSSMSSSSHTTKGDETFVPNNRSRNATFDADLDTEVNRTYLHVDHPTDQNATINLNSMSTGNTTFDTNKNRTVTQALDNTINLDGNRTVNLSNTETVAHPPAESPISRSFPGGLYVSTPSRQIPSNHVYNTDIETISPILADEFGGRKLDNHHLIDNQTYNNTPILSDRTNGKKPSQATFNFDLDNLENAVEFEKTLSLLENNQDEAELDDLLNSFGKTASSDKIRQTLDNIKKRHSLINIEKQQQDEQKRLDVSANHINDLTIVRDRHRMNDSINKLVMSSSGNGERLLRRSRLYDDDPLSTSLNADNKHVIKNSDGITTSADKSYNIGNDNINGTHTYSNNDNQKTETGESIETDKNNRDRFKTIRIFKRPPENAKMVPDSNDFDIPMEPNNEMAQANEHFITKNTNNTISTTIDTNEIIDSRRSTSATGLKRSALARPKFLSGIAKREPASRSSSQEILSNKDNVVGLSSIQSVKSPMGVKAKSIHNLAGNTNRYSYASDNRRESRHLDRTVTTTSGMTTLNKNDNVFKVPQTNSTFTRRQPTSVKKLSLVRPSSGYYSMNTKRGDFDNESGKLSSNNSLSSSSSRGSLHKQEINEPELSSSRNQLFVADESRINQNLGLNLTKTLNGIAKPSALRPPTNKRSGLPRPSGIPKR